MATMYAPTHRGFTLIEALVTVSILAVLLAVSVPSALDWIRKERVRASTAEMVSDIHFARSEATRRSADVQVTFRTNTSQTCYTVHTRNMTGPCNCTLGEGSACPIAGGGNRFELKTVSIDRSTSVTMSANQSIIFQGVSALPINGLIQVDFDGGSTRQLRVLTNPTGRPQICAPAGSTIAGYPLCG